MARKKKDEVDPRSEELTHSPFAALGGLSASEPSSAEERDTPTNDGGDEAAVEPTRPEGRAEPLRFDRKLVVRRETKGRGGKTVTRIQGLPASHRDELARRMKKALGCAASADGEDLLLHGSVVDRAADWLRAEGARQVIEGN